MAEAVRCWARKGEQCLKEGKMWAEEPPLADVLVGRPRAHDLLDGIRSFERRTSVCVQRFLRVSLSVDRAQQVAWRTGPG